MCNQEARLKAVIWDMDGVIVDSGPLHFRAWKELAEERGIELTEEEFKKTFGMRNPDILSEIFVGAPPKAGSLRPEEIKHLSDRKEEKFRRLAVLGVKAMPGVISLLQKLREAGFKSCRSGPTLLGQAIASSTPLQNIKLILNMLKINDFFHAIVSDEDVTHGKPDPEGFLIAAKRLNVNPEECLVIEDAVAGIKAARNAGMKSIAVTNTVTREKLALADLVVDSLEELNLNIISKL